MKAVDIHEGIESTLLILQNRLKGVKSALVLKLLKNMAICL